MYYLVEGIKCADAIHAAQCVIQLLREDSRADGWWTYGEKDFHEYLNKQRDPETVYGQKLSYSWFLSEFDVEKYYNERDIWVDNIEHDLTTMANYIAKNAEQDCYIHDVHIRIVKQIAKRLTNPVRIRNVRPKNRGHYTC